MCSWKVYVEELDYGQSSYFYVFDLDTRQILFVSSSKEGPLNVISEMPSVDDGTLLERRTPSFSLPRGVSQQLLEALWTRGFRPSQYNESGENAALKDAMGFSQRNLEKFIDKTTKGK